MQNLCGKTHTKILEAPKAEVKDNMILQYFDLQKEITIECDASQKGLGACLLQDGKPVNFSSRSLIIQKRDTVTWNAKCLLLPGRSIITDNMCMDEDSR